mgnify:FL=1
MAATAAGVRLVASHCEVLSEVPDTVHPGKSSALHIRRTSDEPVVLALVSDNAGSATLIFPAYKEPKPEPQPEPEPEPELEATDQPITRDTIVKL